MCAEHSGDYPRRELQPNTVALAFIKIVRNAMTTVSRAGGVDLFPAGGATEGSIVIDGKRLSSAVSVCIGICIAVMRSHEPGARTFTRI